MVQDKQQKKVLADLLPCFRARHRLRLLEVGPLEARLRSLSQRGPGFRIAVN
jgi:hypothetical protein